MASVGNLENPDGFPGSSSRSRPGAGGGHLPRPHLPRPHLVPAHLPRPHPARPALPVDLAGRLLRAGRSAARPVVSLALRPPLVPASLHPARLVDQVDELGATRRGSLLESLLESLRDGVAGTLDVLVPAVAEAVLGRLDLTAVVRERVDLDAVVAGVDLDAAAARLDVDAVVAGVDLDPIIARVDVNAVAAQLDIDAILDRLDLTELVQRRVDLNTVAADLDIDAVLDRLDLTELVRRRVDLNSVAADLDIDAVLDRLDLTELVQRRVDLDAVVAGVDLDEAARRIDVESILNRLDLTSIVLERVDLDVLVNAVLARIDLVGLAEEIIDAVDLPEIIRESTGSMASDTVRGARMQGIHADEAVGRAVDRILLRRSHRQPSGPEAAPQVLPSPPAEPTLPPPDRPGR